MRFFLKISGTQSVGDAPNIQVDGLTFQYAGPSREVQFSNQGSSSTLTYIYQVEPTREGSFTVPSQQIRAAGQMLTTQPVTLKVMSAADGRNHAVAWAEIISPKKTMYVGEMIPVEIRLCVDGAVRSWRPGENMPELKSETFTQSKLIPPRKSEEAERAGRPYQFIRFKTVISPTRAGIVSLGPANFEFAMVVPRASSAQLNRAFGGIDLDDSMFAHWESRRVSAPAVEIEVKPLPVEGRPEGFSGAVGKFTMAVSGKPRQVKAGDPVTMKVEIQGEGNFDRVAEPMISESDGWRPYPATSSFRAENDSETRGTKTFEQAVIPEVKKTAMPSYRFVYFDPSTEKYVTLSEKGGPLEIRGDITPPAPLPVLTATSPQSKPTAKPIDDILGIRYERGPTRSFTPWYRLKLFWIIQAFPFLFFTFRAGGRFLKPRDATRDAALRDEKTKLEQTLRQAGSRPELYDAAIRLLQIKTALLLEKDPPSVDAPTVVSAYRLDPEKAASIEEMFRTRAELLYSGGKDASDGVPEGEREHLIGTISHIDLNRPALARR